MPSNTHKMSYTHLTTGQVAKLLEVAPRTVSKWFDSGSLTGFKLPGSNDRRISKVSLIEFCKQHKMPYWKALERENTYNITVVGMDLLLLEGIQASVQKCTWNNLSTFLQFGLSVQKEPPDGVILDFSIGRQNCIDAISLLSDKLEYTTFIGMVNEDDGNIISIEGFNWILQKPVNQVKLIDIITTLVKEKGCA